jgi:hypothetical protein
MSGNGGGAVRFANRERSLALGDDRLGKPLMTMPVDAVDTAAVLAVLQPIWQGKPETASRLRGRIEAVLDAARVAGHTPPDRLNPARWKGHLAKILPKPNKSRRHHAAMAYSDVPQFARGCASGNRSAPPHWNS